MPGAGSHPQAASGERVARARQVPTAARTSGPGRKAPAPRRLPTSLMWAQLQNPDPTMHYVVVGKHTQSYAQYVGLGYQPVRQEEGGVNFAAVAPGTEVKSQFVENKDSILMQIPLEERERIEREGIGGNGGQEHLDAIAEQLSRRRLPEGMRSNYFNTGGDLTHHIASIDGVPDHAEDGAFNG